MSKSDENAVGFRKLWPLVLRLALISTFLATVIVLVAKNRADRNECWMTFMWGRIGFVRIAQKDTTSSYSLHIYGENKRLLEIERDLRNALTGIPVLFVPGNAGSGYQARSLGSILHNKTAMHDSRHRFDMFSVDFNEELSGLSVDYLKEQSEFVGRAVQTIYSLYRTPPKGIIFLGHSMGGVVIRSLLLDPKFDPKIMSAVITLASPHKESPLLLSPDVGQYWEQIEDAWAENRREEVKHIPVVSLSAGFKDDLIHEGATRSPSVRHFSTTSLDRVWLEADHLCIVWCNQLVRLLSRFVINFAESPTTFKKDPDAVVQRFFETDGYELSSLKEPTKSYTIPEGKAFVALAPTHKNRGGSFVSSPSRLINRDWRLSAVFGATNVSVEESAIYDIVTTSGLPEFSPTARDVLKGLLGPIYSTEVKRTRMILLPINITDPAIVFKARMEYTSCKFFNDTKYPTRMIFTTDSNRRYSRGVAPRVHTLKMYKIDEKDNGVGHVLIVANPKCNYKLSIRTDRSRTFMRPFQKHISSIMALFVAYCIASHCFQSCFPNSRFPGGMLILVSGIMSVDSVSLVIVSLLVVVLYEAWTLISTFLHCILLKIRGFELSFTFRICLSAFLSALAFKTHSFPILVIAVLLGIRNSSSQSLRNLYCASIQLSIVPFVVYVWNLNRYKAIFGLFPDHHLISAVILLLRTLFDGQWPLPKLASSPFLYRAFVFANTEVNLMDRARASRVSLVEMAFGRRAAGRERPNNAVAAPAPYRQRPGSQPIPEQNQNNNSNNNENTRIYPDDLAWIREQYRAGNAIQIVAESNRRRWRPVRRRNVQRHVDPSEFEEATPGAPAATGSVNEQQLQQPEPQRLEPAPEPASEPAAEQQHPNRILELQIRSLEERFYSRYQHRRPLGEEILAQHGNLPNNQHGNMPNNQHGNMPNNQHRDMPNNQQREMPLIQIEQENMDNSFDFRPDDLADVYGFCL